MFPTPSRTQMRLLVTSMIVRRFTSAVLSGHMPQHGSSSRRKRMQAHLTGRRHRVAGVVKTKMVTGSRRTNSSPQQVCDTLKLTPYWRRLIVVLGHTILHELTYLDSLAAQAGLEEEEEGGTHSTLDVTGYELKGPRDWLNTYKGDPNVASPDYNAESYAAAATGNLAAFPIWTYFSHHYRGLFHDPLRFQRDKSLAQAGATASAVSLISFPSTPSATVGPVTVSMIPTPIATHSA